MDAGLPPFGRACLLLDLDGTLLDLAPTPEAVVVPPGLPDTLRTLRRCLGGALAIVTGRAIEVVDALLDDVPQAVAGEHGGAIRYAPGGAVERPPGNAPPQAWIDAAEALEREYPGARLEVKARGFGVHFRLAPEAGPAIRDRLAALVRDAAGFELMAAKMLWEVRPRNIDKGGAVERLMRVAPFQGRLPVYIGDDVTDEDGIRAACAQGGTGLRVGDWFGDAAGVRAWLTRSAAAGTWGDMR